MDNRSPLDGLQPTIISNENMERRFPSFSKNFLKAMWMAREVKWVSENQRMEEVNHWGTVKKVVLCVLSWMLAIGTIGTLYYAVNKSYVASSSKGGDAVNALNSELKKALDHNTDLRNQIANDKVEKKIHPTTPEDFVTMGMLEAKATHFHGFSAKMRPGYFESNLKKIIEEFSTFVSMPVVVPGCPSRGVEKTLSMDSLNTAIANGTTNEVKVNSVFIPVHRKGEYSLYMVYINEQKIYKFNSAFVGNVNEPDDGVLASIQKALFPSEEEQNQAEFRSAIPNGRRQTTPDSWSSGYRTLIYAQALLNPKKKLSDEILLETVNRYIQDLSIDQANAMKNQNQRLVQTDILEKSLQYLNIIFDIVKDPNELSDALVKVLCYADEKNVLRDLSIRIDTSKINSETFKDALKITRDERQIEQIVFNFIANFNETHSAQKLVID